MELTVYNTRCGSLGEDKEAELPPAILPSYDDSVNHAGLLEECTPPSKKEGKTR